MFSLARFSSDVPILGAPKEAAATLPKQSRLRAEDFCRLSFIFADLVVIFAALLLAHYIRFDVLGRVLPPESFFAPVGGQDLGSYAMSIIFGGLLLQFILLQDGAYDNRALLRFRRSFALVCKAVVIWSIAFSGISLILEVNIWLSRVFVAIAAALALTMLLGVRFALQRVTLHTRLTAALKQRVVFVDWTERAAKVAGAVLRDRWSPYEMVACVPNVRNCFTRQPPAEMPTLSHYRELKTFCEEGNVDIVVLADGWRAEDEVLALARECEKAMVTFMVIPSGFQILLSGLGLTTISGVPLLGVTQLRLNHPFSRAVKRIVDILGASIGLILAAPIIALFGLLVYRESPGPIFYRQLRVGRRGRHFEIIKIRSMKLNAEAESGACWATRNDHRTLRVGAFMRRWNIDELPQFWNVFKGDLSLVGPRPERPELIERFREEILYYNARHNIIPGMTGWAQVNGFRGDTDLSERIRCDIYYIENWTPILDVQIMFMTLYRWEGAH